ncbi:MAG: hypothetical protein LBV50_05880 [Novosphingobium sp.]|jgi:hypothetical protein|nr:hypothetical protein [Novosphingobium sp.]
MRSLHTIPLAIPLALAMTAILSACGAGGARPQGTGAPPASRPPVMRQGKPRQPVRAPVTHPPAAAQAQQLAGGEKVIGATGAELVRQFGPARLDVWEGDARKLQFTGAACVLDVYLYPAAPGREPQATYVDARRSDDGRDTDRATCIRALRKP